MDRFVSGLSGAELQRSCPGDKNRLGILEIDRHPSGAIAAPSDVTPMIGNTVPGSERSATKSPTWYAVAEGPEETEPAPDAAFSPAGAIIVPVMVLPARR